MDQRERARREDLKADRATSRVLRGGAFNFDLWGVRCAWRGRGDPLVRDSYIGFRVVVLLAF
jgi:formylglycine-generating enzyme required for sulfatase activity